MAASAGGTSRRHRATARMPSRCRFCCTGRCTQRPSAPRATITLISCCSGRRFSSTQGTRCSASQASGSSASEATWRWPCRRNPAARSSGSPGTDLDPAPAARCCRRPEHVARRARRCAGNAPSAFFVENDLNVNHFRLLKSISTPARKNSSASKGISNRLELNPAKSAPPSEQPTILLFV